MDNVQFGQFTSNSFAKKESHSLNCGQIQNKISSSDSFAQQSDRPKISAVKKVKWNLKDTIFQLKEESQERTLSRREVPTRRSSTVTACQTSPALSHVKSNEDCELEDETKKQEIS